MTQPTPVDVNKLKSILGNAKQIMQKVETDNFKTGNIDPRMVSEDGIGEMINEGSFNQNTMTPNPMKPLTYTPEMVMNSRLPEAVKRAMIEKPIQPANGLTHSFNLDDVQELVDKPMGYPKPRKNINENKTVNSDMITISRSELDHIITEKILHVLADSYNRTITEQTIKKTIRLISEGKIAAKKKM